MAEINIILETIRCAHYVGPFQMVGPWGNLKSALSLTEMISDVKKLFS